MNTLMISLLAFAGFVLVLGGVGYIEEAPLTIGHTLLGATVSLLGFVLWILAGLWHQMTSNSNPKRYTEERQITEEINRRYNNLPTRRHN